MTTDARTLDLLGAAMPIGLEELNERSALAERTDHKYLLPRATFVELLAWLVGPGGYRVLEIDGLRAFTYRSVYYDTPDLQTYRQHMQRRRRRFKVRTRHYVESDVQRLEVKMKGWRGQTVKRGQPLRHDYFQPLPADAQSFAEATLAARYGAGIEADLEPVLLVEYIRATLVSAAGDERVTCDWDLAYRSAAGATAALDSELVLVETKSAAGRGAAGSALKARRVRPLSASKYAAGIALTHPNVKHNDLLWLLRRHFTAGQGPPTSEGSASHGH